MKYQTPRQLNVNKMLTFFYFCDERCTYKLMLLVVLECSRTRCLCVYLVKACLPFSSWLSNHGAAHFALTLSFCYHMSPFTLWWIGNNQYINTRHYNCSLSRYIHGFHHGQTLIFWSRWCLLNPSPIAENKLHHFTSCFYFHTTKLLSSLEEPIMCRPL